MRVRYIRTGAAGTEEYQTNLTSPHLGDLSGAWSYVVFDDGLRCWVRTIMLEREERG